MPTAGYEPQAAYALDECDIALLVALAEHKILSTYQLMVLFFDSLRTAQKRIKGLKDAGFIQTFSWRNRRSNRDSDRHVLSAAGAALVCERQNLTRAQLGWIPVDEHDARKRLWHISGANAFFCELIEATLETTDTGLLTWRPEHQIKTAGATIQPDGGGRILHPGGISEFLFEYDRSTENRGPMIAKFARYLRVVASWRGEPSLFPSVLVLVPDHDREAWLRSHLATAAAAAEPEEAMVTTRFYASNLALLKARGVLGAIWRPILGSGRVGITALPTSDHTPDEAVLASSLGRRWRGADKAP
jgi:hypothetical protein